MAKSVTDQKKKNLQLKLAFARYYKWITLLIIIAIIALSYFYILEPKYQQVGIGGKYNLASLENELAKRKDYLDNLKQLVANYQKVSQEEIEKLKAILPEEKDIPGLFVQLQALAEEQGFLLASVSINEMSENVIKNEAPSGLQKLNISLNLIGRGESSYDEVKGFLSALEYNLRLFDVNAVYFSPDSPDYTINLYTYYYQN